MAARLDPEESVQPMRQSFLHHLVAERIEREALLMEVRDQLLPAMQKQGPVVAWIVDDASFQKKASIRSTSASSADNWANGITAGWR